MATYITFGFGHTHRVNGHTLDYNCVAKVRDRDHAFELFGPVWSMEYNEEAIKGALHCFPRGIIDLT